MCEHLHRYGARAFRLRESEVNERGKHTADTADRTRQANISTHIFPSLFLLLLFDLSEHCRFANFPCEPFPVRFHSLVGIRAMPKVFKEKEVARNRKRLKIYSRKFDLTAFHIFRCKRTNSLNMHIKETISPPSSVHCCSFLL